MAQQLAERLLSADDSYHTDDEPVLLVRVPKKEPEFTNEKHPAIAISNTTAQEVLETMLVGFEEIIDTITNQLVGWIVTREETLKNGQTRTVEIFTQLNHTDSDFKIKGRGDSKYQRPNPDDEAEVSGYINRLGPKLR